RSWPRRPGSASTRAPVRTSANSRGGWSQPSRATWRSVSAAALVRIWERSDTPTWCHFRTWRPLGDATWVSVGRTQHGWVGRPPSTRKQVAVTERDGTTPEEPGDDSTSGPRPPWGREPEDPFGFGARGERPTASGPGGGGPGAARTGVGGRGRFIPTILIVIGVITAITWVAQLWTEFLWYDSVGFR